MDRPEVYEDVLGDALSFSSQRVAQLGSLVTARSHGRGSAQSTGNRRSGRPR